ncbi:Uncharacterized protein dnm_048470 [Desulfonema magnum]|uniref:Uncharacterized protein n=1 Tax=Desulfonema magnum TaxID=45655 RepID=A0A975GPH2_9BACT|nr:Uncharacterized protein dnm_048470 [Desulfonema magnum]
MEIFYLAVKRDPYYRRCNLSVTAPASQYVSGVCLGMRMEIASTDYFCPGYTASVPGPKDDL